MIYVPSEYSNYKYLVGVSDNYVILSNDNQINGSWDNYDSVDVIYQYFTPSIYTIETSYSSNTSRRFTNYANNISDSIFVRADFPQLFICNFICVLIFAFVLNGITRLVKRGGALFGV